MTQHHPELIADIADFVAREGMSEITFGRKAMGDPHFVRDLKNGRELWPRTEAKARKFMAEYVAPPATQHATPSEAA